MTFAWESHHFINQISCLDLANTVVWRNHPAKTEDRLQDRAQLEAWADACRRLGRLDEGCERSQSLTAILRIRQSVDLFFRSGEGWPNLIRLYALALSRRGTKLERALLHSAVVLALGAEGSRVKVCGNCGWLFIDRTKNLNKRWCIPELCGNRTKARRHYARKRAKLTESSES